MTPQGLLDVAESLCPMGPGRPAHAALRRAVSTAYYALFAAVTDEVARLFTPTVRVAARRLLEHSGAWAVFHRIGATGKVPWLEGNPVCHEDLLFVAGVFTDLQAQRYMADYDYTYVPNKAQTLSAIGYAGDGVRRLKAGRTSCRVQIEVACLAMITDDRTRRRMVRSR